LSQYKITVNQQSYLHETYESAQKAWSRISLAVEGGRSIEAKLYRRSSMSFSEMKDWGIEPADFSIYHEVAELCFP
jgi:hypothetical protein